jgi:hypothetical protein
MDGMTRIILKSISLNILLGITHIRSFCHIHQKIYRFVRLLVFTIFVFDAPLGGLQEEKYAVVNMTGIDVGRTPSILEEVEVSRAIFEVYEGGVVCTAPSESCVRC